MIRQIKKIALAAGICLVIQGCMSIGPKTINNDQYNYNIAINKGLNEQMLLNLVQMRYGDSPMFLRISSVVNSYSIEEQMSALGYFSSGPGYNYKNISPLMKFTDRPTITYMPLTGEKFAKSLLVPIPDSVILSFIDMGWSADYFMRLCMRSINGIDNREVRASGGVKVDKNFILIVQAFRRLQDVKAIRTWLKNSEAGAVEFMAFENKKNDPAVDQDIALVKQLLVIQMEAPKYRIGFNPEGNRDTQIELQGRSIYEIMQSISAEIDVPSQDIDKKAVLPTPDYESFDENEPGPLIKIHSSAQKPSDGFIAIRYRDSWFWIADSDFISKKLFSVLMALFMITESGTRDFAPILTIPTG